MNYEHPGFSGYLFIPSIYLYKNFDRSTPT